MRSARTGIAAALEDLRRSTAGDLKYLRRSWSGAYEITGAPIWRAVRRDDRLTLIASSPGKLRDLITADYTARPVPRTCPCPQCRPGVTECGAGAEPSVDRVLARAREGLSEQSGPRPPLPAPAPHPLMTPGEVCDVFGVSNRTAVRWEREGTLQCIRLPSDIRRFFRAQVEALLRDEPLSPEQVRAVRERAASWPLPPRRAAAG